MAGEDYSCSQCLKLVFFACVLMLYELVFFIAFVSLSIGSATGVKLVLLHLFGIDLHIALETFCSWYTLAATTEVHLKLYRKCIYARFREKFRTHGSILQGFPRLVYFILYCLAVYGIYYEYEAVHAYKPNVLRVNATSTTTAVQTKHHGLLRRHNRNFRPVTRAEDFAPEAPHEKLHTAFFLGMMSYIVYSSGQILCLFMIRLTRAIPIYPFFPQIYATFSMLIMQAVVSVFYAFPLIMTLVACHMFHVDGVSTYMFSLCLALLVALAAAQLESENPFPTEPRLGPYFYFEAQYRARTNLIFVFLPIIAYYYFERSRSYPLTAMDHDFALFTFWLMMALLHTVKSLYLTTWRPMNAGQVAPAPQPEQNYDAARDVPLFQPFPGPDNAERARMALVEPNSQGQQQRETDEYQRLRYTRRVFDDNNPLDEAASYRAEVNYFDEAWNDPDERGGNNGLNRKNFFAESNESFEYIEQMARSSMPEISNGETKQEVGSCFDSIGEHMEKVKGMLPDAKTNSVITEQNVGCKLLLNNVAGKQTEDAEGNIGITANKTEGKSDCHD